MGVTTTTNSKQTYVSIAAQTLGSAAASVTFSSISSAYTDLMLVFSGTTGGADSLKCQINSDTGTNYSYTILYGDGSSAGSVRSSSVTSLQLGTTTTSQGVIISNLQNYANTTTYKTEISTSNQSGAQVNSSVGLWRSTSAISSVYLFLGGGGNFNAGSTFTLYGILGA
jgi:hypothetical protein